MKESFKLGSMGDGLLPKPEEQVISHQTAPQSYACGGACAGGCKCLLEKPCSCAAAVISTTWRLRSMLALAYPKGKGAWPAALQLGQCCIAQTACRVRLVLLLLSAGLVHTSVRHRPCTSQSAKCCALACPAQSCMHKASAASTMPKRLVGWRRRGAGRYCTAVHFLWFAKYRFAVNQICHCRRCWFSAQAVCQALRPVVGQGGILRFYHDA